MITIFTAFFRFTAAARWTKVRSFYLGLCTLALAIAVHAGEPRIITFDAPGAGTGPNQGTGCLYYDCYLLLNNLGEITGYYLDANNVYHGFLRSPKGKITSFDAPGADMTPQSFNGTVPNGINDVGAITGYYVDSSGNVHGFIRSPDGEFATFDVPGGSLDTWAIAISLEGAVVGYYLNQNNVFLSFLRKPDGSFETWSGSDQCETSPSTGCYGGGALSINAFGTISGIYQDNSGNFVTHGLVRGPQGKLTAYTDPAAGTGPYQGTTCPACASPVNELGAIAGLYIDPSNVTHGFIRSPSGGFTDFDVPGAGPYGIGCTSDCPLGLNDQGAITSSYPDANNVYHGFLRSPEGKITSFDAPGANTTPGSYSGTYPYSINDAGEITGSYQDLNNVVHGFVLLPNSD